jgi:predicted metal-dependent hydrolase
MYPTKEELDQLYFEGLKKFKEGNFYLAHDLWEEMWHYKQLKDRIFIQGLIQISASFYKIQCGNLTGARSLLEKSINKFQNYSGIHRNINLNRLKDEILLIQKKYNEINSTYEFSFDMVPSLN